MNKKVNKLLSTNRQLNTTVLTRNEQHNVVQGQLYRNNKHNSSWMENLTITAVGERRLNETQTPMEEFETSKPRDNRNSNAKMIDYERGDVIISPLDDGHNYTNRGQRYYYNQGYQSSSSNENEEVNQSWSSVDTQISTRLHFDGQVMRGEDSYEQKEMSPAKRRCYNISEYSGNARCLDVKSSQKNSRSDYKTDKQQKWMQTNYLRSKQMMLTHGAEIVQSVNSTEFRNAPNKPVEIKTRTTSDMTSYDKTSSVYQPCGVSTQVAAQQTINNGQLCDVLPDDLTTDTLDEDWSK